MPQPRNSYAPPTSIKDYYSDKEWASIERGLDEMVEYATRRINDKADHLRRANPDLLPYTAQGILETLIERLEARV